MLALHYSLQYFYISLAHYKQQVTVFLKNTVGCAIDTTTKYLSPELITSFVEE
jgi:hypothetical protein